MTGKGLYCSRPQHAIESYRPNLKGKLPSTHQDEYFVDNISQACCCVFDIPGKELNQHDRCDLLYYLMGSIVYEKIKDKSKFATVMSKLPEVLKEHFTLHGCKIEKEKVGKELFAKMNHLGGSSFKLEGAFDGRGSSSNVSCERYKKYLGEIGKIYGIVEDLCNQKKGGAECEEIKKGHWNKSPQELYALMYGVVKLPKPTFLLPQGQPEECLKQLPSEQIYAEFDGCTGKCTDKGKVGNVQSALQSTLGNLKSPEDHTGAIIGAWCDARNVGKNIISEGERCNFLYYWLGTTVSSILGSTDQFPNAMNTTYQKLEQLGNELNCNNKYHNIAYGIFTAIEKVYKYSQDYTTIAEYAGRSRNHDSSCTHEYHYYLEDVFPAYSYMNMICKDKSNDTYCTHFKQIATKHSLQELLQLKCSLKYTPDCPRNTVAAAISGTLATAVGLPVIGYALYKYNLLPPWIKNSFGNTFGRNSSTRNRRSTKHHFDTFTEETSTLYTTDTSTTGSMDESTIYSRRPLPRGAENNNARQKKNVAYHRM